MRTFSKPILRAFWSRHPQAEAPLLRWWRRIESANWRSMADVRADFPTTDLVKAQRGDLLVFDIGGNDYRLICRIQFGRTPLYILFVGTHAE